MTKINHVRIYNDASGAGFDIILRVRGGIQKHGTYPTIEAALEAAFALKGRKRGDPIFVYEGDFASGLAAALAPAFGKLEVRA